MFGSLVVCLPFDHTGGGLLLRHQDRDFLFDGQALLQGAESPSAAYVAFFSDVEHEVTEVTSGHRVTITYNLYFDSKKGVPVTKPSTQLEHPFLTRLKNIKEDADLRRAHQVLGFGLQHAYPFKTAILKSKNLRLKGIDATVIKILKHLGITYRFFLLYRENAKNKKCPFRILSTNILHGSYCDDESSFERITKAGESWVVWNEPEDAGAEEDWTKMTGHGSITLNWYRYLYNHWGEGQVNRTRNAEIPTLDVEWITEPNENYVDNSVALAYGNEPSLGFHYHQLCVVATFGNEFKVEDKAKKRR